MVDISGRCPPGFGAVRDAFAENFEHAGDVGASVAVTLDGELVVDLWGGTQDVDGAVPWEEDTIINVFSTTKTMSCLSLLVLVSRGLVDVDAPVARYWPEFAAAGKAESVLVRHLLSHTAGLPAWDARLDGADLYDWDRVTGLLAAQEPWWEPGWRSGYHGITQGNLVGEVVRRVDGRSVGRVLRRGDRRSARRRLPHRHRTRARRPRRPRHPAERRRPRRPRRRADRDAAGLDPLSGGQPAPAAGAVVGDPVAAGRDPRRRRARQCPQCGPGPVRGLGGRLGPWRRPAVEGGRRPDLRRPGRRPRPRARHRCHVRRRATGSTRLAAPIAPNERVCYWGGWGGSLVVNDVDQGMTMAYVMNRMGQGTVGDDRAHRILRAVYASLA